MRSKMLWLVIGIILGMGGNLAEKTTGYGVDYFNDGDYTKNPEWIPSSGSWSASNFYLEKTTTDAWESITIPSTTATGIWGGRVKNGAMGNGNDVVFSPIATTDNIFVIGNEILIYVSWNNNIYVSYYTDGIMRWQDAIPWTSDTSWHDFIFIKDINNKMSLYWDGVKKWERTETTYTITSSKYIKVGMYKKESKFDNLLHY